MVSKKGTLLEKNVEKLLRLSGFRPELNKIINGYEIDVFISYKSKNIAFECKQYEKSSLAVRNLIHQWDSKNKELKLDKIVLVLVCCDISQNDYDLANKYDMVLWGEATLDSLFEKVIANGEKERDRVIEKIGINIDPEAIKRKEEIDRLKTEVKAIEDKKTKQKKKK